MADNSLQNQVPNPLDESHIFEKNKREIELKKLQADLEKTMLEIKVMKERSEVEINKAKNESLKLEADKLKIEAETRNIKIKPFDKYLSFVETIGKIILGAGVMAFSYSLFVQPYFALKEVKLQNQIDSTNFLNKQLSREKSDLSTSIGIQDSLNKISEYNLGLKKREIESLAKKSSAFSQEIDRQQKRINRFILYNEEAKQAQLIFNTFLRTIDNPKNTIEYFRRFSLRIPKVAIFQKPNKDSIRLQFSKDFTFSLIPLRALYRQVYKSEAIIDSFFQIHILNFRLDDFGFTQHKTEWMDDEGLGSDFSNITSDKYLYTYYKINDSLIVKDNSIMPGVVGGYILRFHGRPSKRLALDLLQMERDLIEKLIRLK